MDQLIVYGSQFSSEAVKDLSPYQSLSCGQRRCHSTAQSFFYILRIAPYRTTENSIRGLVITIIDSLSALAPPRDQDSARPVKNSPRGTASGGVFTGRGVPPPGENSLETGGSSVRMGGWGDSAEEAAVGGAPAPAVAGFTVLGPVCLVYAFLPCSPKFANTACRLPFGSTIFQTFAWCFSAQRFCGDLTGISQKHNQFACIMGKA